MVVAANKRSVMTLFSGATDLYSHQTRIVLGEKGVTVDVEQIEQGHLPQDLIDLNPYASVPTLIDRDLTLYDAHIIMEYLDERFPHPPLMPVYPVARANARLMMYRIKKDWYAAFDVALQQGDSKEGNAARRLLRDDLTILAPMFKEMPYFMSEEFSLVDCYMAPIMWRLPLIGIEFTKTGAKELKAYMTRLFERPSFIASLSEDERQMRPDYRD